MRRRRESPPRYKNESPAQNAGSMKMSHALVLQPLCSSINNAG